MNMVPTDKKKKYAGGFTLLEMLVATSLFIIVAFMGVNSVLSILAANKKSETVSVLMNNISSTLNDMTYHIRFAGDVFRGAQLYCDEDGAGYSGGSQDCWDTGGKFLAMDRPEGNHESILDDVVYQFVLDGDGRGQIEKSVNGGSTFLPMTDPRIDITHLTFYVYGSGFTDERQDRVLIVLQGVVESASGEQTDFSIQTMVLPRVADA